MTFVIAEPCIDVKDRACVDECPVDCIYEGGRMLYIQPDECIDCAACEPVCPSTPSSPKTRSPRNGNPSRRSTPSGSTRPASAPLAGPFRSVREWTITRRSLAGKRREGHGDPLDRLRQPDRHPGRRIALAVSWLDPPRQCR